jgi:hypothetical protein
MVLSLDEIVAKCLPPNPNWKSNFAIFISLKTDKNTGGEGPCNTTVITREIEIYNTTNNFDQTEDAKLSEDRFNSLYQVWKKLSHNQKDEFETYLQKAVPVLGDNFDEGDDWRVLKVECKDFYAPIIAAFKTRDIQNNLQQDGGRKRKRTKNRSNRNKNKNKTKHINNTKKRKRKTKTIRRT